MESKKMIKLTDRLLKIQQGKSGPPSYSGESKLLIDRIADGAENSLVWAMNWADGREFTRGMTAEQMWRHFKKKYNGTKGELFKVGAIIGMIPLIRQRLAFKAEIGEVLHFE